MSRWVNLHRSRPHHKTRYEVVALFEGVRFSSVVRDDESNGLFGEIASIAQEDHMAGREPLPQLPRWEGKLSHPFYSKVVKRGLDFLFALVLLPFGLLLMAPLALWVKLDSPGPVFYRAVRGGYHNRPFYILKFRTMVVDADKTGGCTAKNDSRVTRAGRFMRRVKLDEIPQLFNILKGDMSFVGPRPELLLYTIQYTPEQQCILWVRPGITDRSSIVYIAQDELVGEENPVENFEKYILPNKNKLRVEYAMSQSFGLDCRLFLETIGGVFGKASAMAKETRNRGASHG